MVDFGQLYDKHVDNLFAFGSRFTNDREMIKDCIQDVFVKLYTKKNILDSVNNIDSYLYVSLKNRINDEFRRNVRLCDNEIDDSMMRGIAETDEYNRERMEREQSLTAFVQKSFDYLSPRQRQIIRLYYLEQRKYDEICRIMGISYQSVRNLMHRSILRLRNFSTKTNIFI